MNPATRTILNCIALLSLTATAACGPKEPGRAPAGSAAATPAYGDILVEGSIGDASNLIPLLASDSTSHGIAGLIFNGLIKYDKDIRIVGDLAESWEISKDGLVIIFHLRKGVRWHDGRPFTAADVLYTYQVTVDPKTPTAYAGDFLKVKKAEVLDDWTFRATYDKPFAPRADELVGRHPAEASAGRQGDHHLPARSAPDRHGGRTSSRSG